MCPGTIINIMRLRDKVIIITGSTTGIGAAMARLFVREGARVLVHGRDRNSGQALVAELGSAAALHIDDLIDPEAAPRLVKAALKNFGRIDALVNNAALTTRSHLVDTDAKFFDRLLAVNLRAPLLLTRAALEPLAATQGAILNIGSVLAHCGQANLVAYSISKGGLMTMSRNLADALGPRRIRVNQLNVGWTLTENEYTKKVADGLSADWPERLPANLIPSGRILVPEDVARGALYWVSDESRPISGSVTDFEQYPVIGRVPNQENNNHEYASFSAQ
jgi:NAD(P)-dependent dehydrogenase (short-subunit alcohol dehydrogenase family)